MQYIINLSNMEKALRPKYQSHESTKHHHRKVLCVKIEKNNLILHQRRVLSALPSTGACHVIGIHKADGKNDSLSVNRNDINKGLSCSANDHMSTCSSPDMDNGEVVVAGMRIQKVDAQDDIPNANHNVVNQVICGSANDP
nr:hypothetical protein [Tanacetum cinerariifolium]